MKAVAHPAAGVLLVFTLMVGPAPAAQRVTGRLALGIVLSAWPVEPPAQSVPTGFVLIGRCSLLGNSGPKI
jgi:hypothetical protein